MVLRSAEAAKMIELFLCISIADSLTGEIGAVYLLRNTEYEGDVCCNWAACCN
jgi:hypothetical protein